MYEGAGVGAELDPSDGVKHRYTLGEKMGTIQGYAAGIKNV